MFQQVQLHGACCMVPQSAEAMVSLEWGWGFRACMVLNHTPSYFHRHTQTPVKPSTLSPYTLIGLASPPPVSPACGGYGTVEQVTTAFCRLLGGVASGWLT